MVSGQVHDSHGADRSVSLQIDVCLCHRRGGARVSALFNTWPEISNVSAQPELVHHVVFLTRDAARKAIFEFIEIYYNRHRRHSSLGYLSPIDYEYAMEALPQAA